MSDQDLTFAEVDEILRIVDGAPRGGELTVSVGSGTLTLKLRGTTDRNTSAGSMPTASPGSAPSSEATPSTGATQQTVPASTEPAEDGSSTLREAHGAPQGDAVHETQLNTSGLVAVTSPMAGVWYRSPTPGEPPFVEVGDQVEEGQQVGIIEVMKLMNRIVAPTAGIVRDVCVDNEGLAEFGTTLVWIEPAA